MVSHRSPDTAHRGNQATQSVLRGSAIQAKLTVNKPGDRFEQEADAVADRVMRMMSTGSSAPPSIQRMCPSCDDEIHQRMCSNCEDEINRKEAVRDGPASAVIPSFSGRGRPLPDSVRAFFEPRFGRDFGGVRIHTGSEAAQSARNLNAHAYTTGSNIVFAAGRYSPGTDHGRKLLAHELTHVVQQRRSGSGAMIQRSCGTVVPATPGCTPDPTISPPSMRFLFDVNCDDFASAEDTRLGTFARGLTTGATVRVVGLASFDGPALLNDKLSCSRAEKGAAIIRSSAPAGITISSVQATGGIKPAFDPTLRSVGVAVSTPLPKPIPPPPVVKPGARTPCERKCSFDFDDCVRRSENPLACLAQRSACLGGCVGAPSGFEVCARLLQPPVEVSGCNHAYIETPTRRYAIITPCTGKLTFADPIFGGVALKTDRSPDPCGRRPTCIECKPKPGVTDLEKCFESQFRAYAGPSLHKIFGPNSNTFAGTLARACCDSMAVKPVALGCLPGWDDPPAPSRSAPCPPGPPVC
jgi:outer membrane protein OmpA-like peptidoglycan-associated protein